MSKELSLKKSLSNINLVKLKTLSFKTPKPFYSMHRFLFRLTNGLWNDYVSKLIALINGKYAQISLEKSLFGSSKDQVLKIAHELKENGFARPDVSLSEDIINSLVSFSEHAPLQCILPTDNYSRDGSRGSNQDQSFLSVRNNFARCDLKVADLVKNPEVQRISLDPYLLQTAQEYLGVKPILSSIVMWWSFPVKDIKSQSAAAAQEYHFDMDHAKFVKFFFYLTDVDTQSGPHCYVQKTHRKLPSKFLKRGRFEDQDIVKHYKDDALELTGPKGTMLIVDTRGLHKGKPLTKGSRLLLQVEFANSLFGQHFEAAPFVELSPEQKTFAYQHYETYFNFLSCGNP